MAKYKRILLKLSGEALAGDKKTGFDEETCIMVGKQVKKLVELKQIDSSFIAIDSTPVMANTAQNNPKSFRKNKFAKDNHPQSDPDCALGVHTATNQINERNYEFYWEGTKIIS